MYGESISTVGSEARSGLMSRALERRPKEVYARWKYGLLVPMPSDMGRRSGTFYEKCVRPRALKRRKPEKETRKTRTRIAQRLAEPTEER